MGDALEMQALLPAFDPDLITFIDEPGGRDGVLRTLTEMLADRGKVKDPESFYQAILSRENVVSTGIGLGVAIPHTKLDDYEDFFIAVGVLRKSGVDWDAIDGSEVRIVFLIGGPSEKQSEYLQILSSITQAIRDPAVRQGILMSGCPQAVINHLSPQPTLAE